MYIFIFRFIYNYNLWGFLLNKYPEVYHLLLLLIFKIALQGKITIVIFSLWLRELISKKIK